MWQKTIQEIARLLLYLRPTTSESVLATFLAGKIISFVMSSLDTTNRCQNALYHPKLLPEDEIAVL